MNRLQQLGITVGNDSKAAAVFNRLFPNFMEVEYLTPNEYINQYWQAYQRDPEGNNNLNGKIFEYILATLCVRERILPLFMSAKVAFVPNVAYDLMFYTAERGPICISAKTSLRERYKQADLEAIALKNVHRKAMCYLLTLNEHEAAGVQEKIRKGDVIGLDNVVVATHNDFNDLIIQLKSFEFLDPPTVKVIDSNQIITSNSVDNLR